MDATIRAPNSVPFRSHQLSLMSNLGLCSFRPITRYSQRRSMGIEFPTKRGSLVKRSNEVKEKLMICRDGIASTTEIDESEPHTTDGVDSSEIHSTMIASIEDQINANSNGIVVDMSQKSDKQGQFSSLDDNNDSPSSLAWLRKNDKILAIEGDDENCLVRLDGDETSIVSLRDEEKCSSFSGHNLTSSLVGLPDDRHSKLVLGQDEKNHVVLVDDDQQKSLVPILDQSGDDKCLVALGEINASLAVEETAIGSTLVQIGLKEEGVDSTRLEESDDLDGVIIEPMNSEMRRQVIQKLAEENMANGKKFFTYPEVVKPGEEIELLLNRSLSTLKDEPDVLVVGGFNEWRWKSFNIRMEKSQLSGEWWSCKIHVPSEAYKIEFVFFNGKFKYDNNNKKDYHIVIEGGMDVVAFEDLLFEEKQRKRENLNKEAGNGIEEEEKTEANRAQAKDEVERGRAKLEDEINKAKTRAKNVWYLEFCESEEGESLVSLFYNKSSSPLARANDVWIHGGINNWRDGLSIVTKLVPFDEEVADWWFAQISMPEEAFVLNWVFADGPPKKASAYDNNNRQDFHATLPKSISESYWIEEEERIFRRLQEERWVREEAKRVKEERISEMRSKTKERALKRFLMSQEHIFYTEPQQVQAGESVTIYYNPSNTILKGKPQVLLRCSFNRWSHHDGPLPLQKMVSSSNSSHLKTTVKVPLDAYMMDFVFCESENGGIFDNKEDMDYHVPVCGGTVKEPSMHIVHVAIEMAPIAKVGGLGDVVTSLSRAVQDLNHHVDVIIPKHNCLNLSNVKDLVFKRSFPWGGVEIKVWFGIVEGLSVYFLEPCNGFFSSGGIYGCRNDSERFSFFCHAALEFLKHNGSQPDIIHCHDWSSAPVAWLFKEHYQKSCFNNTRLVFTIHNLEYGAHFIRKAMDYSDKATTVSRTYSKEVATNPAIAPNLHKFHGILNGIDHDIWDPYNDKFIPVAYTSENVVEGKRAAKDALQRKLGLRVADIPLIGVVSRLTHQKGIHLIKHAIWRTLDQNGQFILLGSAPDSRIQHEFVDMGNDLHSAHNDVARLRLNYDEPLSHLIYSAADFILVPSMYEPCGLTQLIAMRYGAIPVVRKTGGLYDTVFDIDHDKERAKIHGLEPNGFTFEGADVTGMDYALDRALCTWYNSRDSFHSLCKRVMEQDWSWNRPALDYLELYHAAKKY